MQLKARSRKVLSNARQFQAWRSALEAAAAAGAGIAAGSVALTGLALLSGMAWARALTAGPLQEKAGSRLPRVRLLGAGAFALGGYLLVRTAHALLAGVRPAPSLLGELTCAVSIVLTVVLFWAVRRHTRPASPRQPASDVRSVAVRLMLTASVLTGLVLNAVFALWKADPLSALPIAGFFFFTGERLLRTERAKRKKYGGLPETGELLASIVACAGAEGTERTSLRIVVCGGGGLGRQVTQVLSEAGHSVSVIERDLKRRRALSDTAGQVVIGDATRPEVLRRVGIGRCDVVAALTGSATTNDRICRAAEREADVRTLMRVPFEEGPPGEASRDAGVRVLDGTDGAFRILELRVAPHAPVAGRRLSDIDLPHGGRVLSRSNGGRVRTAETVFAPGEGYVVAAEAGTAKEVTRLFRGMENCKRSV